MGKKNKLKKCVWIVCIGICIFSLYHFRDKILTMMYTHYFHVKIRMLETPSYNLAENFPAEHVKTFNDFLSFCAFMGMPPIVKARIELNNPVQYENFLSAVSMSFSSIGLLSTEFPLRFSLRNSFFADNVLDPLSHDLKNENYSGYHFKVENLPQFFREFFKYCYDELYEDKYGGLGRIRGLRRTLPREFYLSGMYAGTFLRIHERKLREAYKTIYDWSSYRKNPGDVLSYRPYYYYSDSERYSWFEFLQAELRNTGHADFADSITETEFEHYRELLVWQLRLDAYLAQKLYEYGDNDNLSTLRDLIEEEYALLKNEPFLQSRFEIADVILRGIDDKVQTSSPFDPSKGIIVLPWIDRDAIDYQQGVKKGETYMNYFSNSKPIEITWKRDMESIDEKTKQAMKDSYEKSIQIIRTMAVICNSLYLDRDLKTMSQLHSKLVSSKNISRIPLDFRYNLDLRLHDLIEYDFWEHRVRREKGGMIVRDVILPWVGGDEN